MKRHRDDELRATKIRRQGGLHQCAQGLEGGSFRPEFHSLNELFRRSLVGEYRSGCGERGWGDEALAADMVRSAAARKGPAADSAQGRIYGAECLKTRSAEPSPRRCPHIGRACRARRRENEVPNRGQEPCLRPRHGQGVGTLGVRHGPQGIRKPLPWIPQRMRQIPNT
jgi:hypothetical protein